MFGKVEKDLLRCASFPTDGARRPAWRPTCDTTQFLRIAAASRRMRRIDAVVTLHAAAAMPALSGNGAVMTVPVSVESHGMTFGAPSSPRLYGRRRTDRRVQEMCDKPRLGREEPFMMPGIDGSETHLTAGVADLNDEIARRVVYRAGVSMRHFPSIGMFN